MLGPIVMGGHVPPHDLDAEAAVLSAVILDPETLTATRVALEPRHFYADANRRIFEALLAVADRGDPVDIVLIASELRTSGRLAQIGGAPYLARIVDATPAVANVAAHAAIVREAYRARRLIGVLQTVAAELYAGLPADEAWRRIKEIAA